MFTNTLTTRTINGVEYPFLISMPNVVELVASDPELPLLMVIVGTEDQLYIYNGDVSRMKHGRNAYLVDPGDHCGDCINISCTCHLCTVQYTYDNIVDCRQEAQAINLQMDLVTLLLATETQYYSLSLMECLNVLDQESSISWRLKIWNNFTHEQQQAATGRAAKFRKWLTEPIDAIAE